MSQARATEEHVEPGIENDGGINSTEIALLSSVTSLIGRNATSRMSLL